MPEPIGNGPDDLDLVRKVIHEETEVILAQQIVTSEGLGEDHIARSWNESHTTQFIEQSTAYIKGEFRDRREARYVALGGLVLILTFALWALRLSPGAASQIMDMLKVLGGAAIGAFGGYGYAKSKQKD